MQARRVEVHSPSRLCTSRAGIDGRREPTHGQVLIILRQQDELVTVATLGSLMNAWNRQDHLVGVLAALVASGKVRQERGGWVAA